MVASDGFFQMYLMITCIFCIFQFEFTPLIKGRDLDFAFELSQSHMTDCVPVPATDPLYLLYTSGTTGLPTVKIIYTFLFHNGF